MTHCFLRSLWVCLLVFSSQPILALDVFFEGVPLGQVLSQLSAESGWRLTADLPQDLPVDFALEGATMETVMHQLAMHANAVFERTADGGHLRRPNDRTRIEPRALKYRGADELEALLTDRLAASVIVDAATNRWILEGSEVDVLQGLRLIDALDIPVRQILIEAKLVSIDTHMRQDLGVRWQLAGSRGRLGGQAQSGGRPPWC